MKNDRTPSSFEEYDDYGNKRIRYMRVGNLLNFPTSLNPKYRGYATRDDISKEVNRIYKLQT